MELHIYVLAPRITKRALSHCYDPLDNPQKHTIRLALDKYTIILPPKSEPPLPLYPGVHTLLLL